MKDSTQVDTLPTDKSKDDLRSSADDSTRLEPQVTFGEGQHEHLKITFNLWSTLGLVYSITATPFGLISYLTFTLVLGGSPFFIYGYIFAVSFNVLLCVALAEISAIYPHSSGHIFWVGRLAPRGWEKCLSYWTGILTSAAWFFWNAGVQLLTGQILIAVAIALYPDYVPAVWHAVLVSFAQGLLAFTWNVPLFRTWPQTLKAMIIITNASVLFMAIALLVRANPKQSARTVFVDIVNESGWSSLGVVFFLGLLPGASAINGFDAASHMVDEMPDPARQVPQVMIGNSVLSAVSGLFMGIVCAFCITKPENLFTPFGGITIIQILYDSLDNRVLFIFSCALYIIVTIIAATACLTTCSRVWWSFSTHQGLPFSKWFSTVSPTWSVPANSLIAIPLISCVISLLQLGPSYVLAAFYTAAAVCFYISYFITLATFLHTKHTRGLPKHYCDLGGLMGSVAVGVSAVWCIFASVWLLFPAFLPVTPETMNYAVVIIAVVIVLFAADWFLRARKTYYVPTTSLNMN